MELGILRVLYGGYKQLLTFVGIRDFNGNSDYSLLGILKMLYMVHGQLAILVGIIHLSGNSKSDI